MPVIRSATAICSSCAECRAKSNHMRDRGKSVVLFYSRTAGHCHLQHYFVHGGAYCMVLGERVLV